MAEQAWHGAAEPVDRLVRVANHDQPRSRLGRGDEAQQLELRGVDVLELVDEDQLKLRAHPVAKPWTRLQQLDRARDEVAKVDQPRLLHAVLIRLVDGGQHLQTFTRARLDRELQRRRMDEVLLHQRDEREKIVGERFGPTYPVQRPEHAGVHVGQELAHHDPLLEPVHEESLAVRCVVTKHAGAEAVEGRDPGLAIVVLQPLVDAARDLARRAGGESEHEDLVPTGDALTHRLLVQIDECMRLAGARPGEHAKWSSYFMDVEWQQVSRSGAGDLIMPVRVSWSQPRLLTATRPR